MAKWFVVYEKWSNNERRVVKHNDVIDADLSYCRSEWDVYNSLDFSIDEYHENSFAIVSLTKIGE